MGQRHQLFIIAQLRLKDSTQPRYRCVAAMHHQWLYGLTALRTCKAVLELFRNKENAEIVSEELATIAATYEDDDEFPPLAAPFVSLLFSGALRLRMEEQYATNSCFFLDTSIGCDEGDNNDGITVLDITNPLDPAYCFVAIGTLGASVRQTVAEHIPLTAGQYLREYYPPGPLTPPPSPKNCEDGSEVPNSSQKDENQMLSQDEMHAQVESEVVKLIESFRDERLVELWMLYEAWPEYEGSHLAAESPPNTHESSRVDGPEDSSVVPTLSGLSLRKAVDQAQLHGDISEPEEALALPGVGTPNILDMLAKLDHHSDASLEILVKALMNEGHGPGSLRSLDLSPYALTADQVITVSTNFPQTKMLKLSGNPHIDGPTLLRILLVLPALSRLNVYNCNGFSPSDLDIVLSSAAPLEVIYHRESMMHDLLVLHGLNQFAKGIRKKTPAFTFHLQSIQRVTDYESSGYSLTSYSPHQIVACLDDFLETLTWPEDYDQSINSKLSVILSGLPRPPHVEFKDRTLGPIPMKGSLASERWLYVMALKEQSGHLRQYLCDSSSVFVFGFVKYRFATLGKAFEGVNAGTNDCARPPPESVEIMGLTEWLQKADPHKTVEGQLVKRVEEKLKGTELISKEQVIKLMEDVPMHTN